MSFADLPAVAMLAGQCLLVAFLLIVFYGDLDTISLLSKRAAQCGKLSFLLAISCLWFGCNNAAKEIVKERVIYLRERDVNVTVVSYSASKLFLLGAVDLFQATLLLGMVKHFTHLPGDFLVQSAFLSVLGLVGTSHGPRTVRRPRPDERRPAGYGSHDRHVHGVLCRGRGVPAKRIDSRRKQIARERMPSRSAKRSSAPTLVSSDCRVFSNNSSARWAKAWAKRSMTGPSAVFAGTHPCHKSL